MKIPEQLRSKVNELDKLVAKYPDSIPVPEAASFLGMDRDGLRRCIEMGKCPFGIAWQKTINGNRAFKIPALTFYLWYTSGAQ